MTLTRLQVDEIKREQADYFNAVRETDIDKNQIKNGAYRQILKSEGLAYWIDVYNGPHGHGFVVREEKMEDGVTYHRAIHEGNERYRDTEWVRYQEVER